MLNITELRDNLDQLKDMQNGEVRANVGKDSLERIATVLEKMEVVLEFLTLLAMKAVEDECGISIEDDNQPSLFG